VTAIAARDLLAERLESGALSLPLLPDVAREVALATSDPDADASRIAPLLRRDQALAGHVLRVANSPMYRPASPIVSLEQALARLGMDAVRRIAFAVACEAGVFRVPGREKEVRALFAHALAAAAFAQEIARARRWNVEEAFLAGLLHDVGQPVILQGLADIEQDTGRLDAEAADAISHELHGWVGEKLVLVWNLPARLAAVARYHHSPSDAADAARLAWIVALADVLAHHLRGEVGLGGIGVHPAAAEIGLYPDEVEAILERADAVRGLVEAMS